MKTVEIREFDKLYRNPQDSQGAHCLGAKSYDELERFVKDFQETNADVDPTLFFKIGVEKGKGDYIQARNYVGLIQLKSGCQIQVLPKIDLSGSNEDKKREISIFLRMLRCLKELSFKTHSSADLRVTNTNLYEIFIQMYVDECLELVKHYLKSNYVNVEDNLTVFKGKLIVNEHIKRNIVHKERFFVCYNDYNLNRPENKLIKSTLMKLQRISTDFTNAKNIRQLLVSFETIDESTNYAKDFANVSHDRSMAFYENLMLWSKVFLLGQSFTSFAGSTSAISLLFPMEKVFEAYVAKLFQRYCTGFDVSAQEKGTYLYAVPRAFALKPDIIIRKNSEKRPLVILDTKWKRLKNDSSKYYGISQADMYQMYAYSKKYDCNNIWLLYPQTAEMSAVKEEILFKANEEDNEVITVSIFFVDLSKTEGEMLKPLLEKLSQKLQTTTSDLSKYRADLF